MISWHPGLQRDCRAHRFPFDDGTASLSNFSETGCLKNHRILALFPSFTAERYGGVQISGREAWRGICEKPEIDAEVFFYEPDQSKTSNLMRAWRGRRRVDTVLVWHLDLVKLVPFIARRGRRLVVFLHGIEAWRAQGAVTNTILRRADLFLSNSDFTWNRFLEFHPPGAGKMHQTVHLGLDEPLKCQPPSREPPGVLMVGRMRKSEDYKGHREMIRIWPRVLQHEPCAELRIVGDGDLRPELESLAEQLGVAGRVCFFGAVPDGRKAELLRESRALVLPSAAEGFGLVYLEAMRMGRPSIVSTLDAGREVVNPPEAGFAVDLKNTDQTLECLLKILRPGAEWDAMSARARGRYETRFTAEHFRRRLTEALMA